MKNKSPDSSSSMINTIAIFLFLASILATFLFVVSDNPHIKQIAAGTLPVLIGGALTFWGIETVRQGYIQGNRTDIYRSEHPMVFCLMVFILRFLPAVILIAAGLYFLISGQSLQLH
jgi:hypothetical protein